MPIHHRCDPVLLMRDDALQAASLLPSGIAQTIVTSPPYFGLRDYGHADQLGAESTVDAYVGNLVAVFRELRRVLADDGTLWLNLGDSYGGAGGSSPTSGSSTLRGNGHVGGGPKAKAVGVSRRPATAGMNAKNLLGVPWRVAFALQADGWILRSDIIWAKPNPMPESVRDRPTKAHEYLFMLTKGPRYHYDQAAVAEPVLVPTVSGKGPRFGGSKYGDDTRRESQTKSGNHYTPKATRNRRTVWTVAPKPFKEAHFAVYPPELIRPCIRASSRPSDVVLDPFSGSGTTGMVALQEGRRYLGIDVSANYLDLSLRTRLADCC